MEAHKFEIDLICEDNRCGGMLTITAPWRDSRDHPLEVPEVCPDCSGEMAKSERPGAVRPMTGVDDWEMLPGGMSAEWVI